MRQHHGVGNRQCTGVGLAGKMLPFRVKLHVPGCHTNLSDTKQHSTSVRTTPLLTGRCLRMAIMLLMLMAVMEQQEHGSCVAYLVGCASMPNGDLCHMYVCLCEQEAVLQR